MGKQSALSSAGFSRLLDSISKRPLYVVDSQISFSHYTPLDLSIHNTNLKHVDVADPTSLQKYIDQCLISSEATVAYGGYLERRAIYDRSDYFHSHDDSTARNIHLGLDLWLGQGAEIFAPLDGVIHSFKNNTNFGDYGPTLILAHEFHETIFYTLYGHLSMESLEGIHVGKDIKKGDMIATLGSERVNGNYPPHLHFQIIRDVQGFSGDYPGVCNKNQLDFYRSNCPNPNLLLKIH